MSAVYEKEPQVTKDLEPGMDRQKEYEAAWNELRKASKALVRVDSHDTKWLLDEFLRHMRVVHNHQFEACLCMAQILHNLIDDE